MSKKQTAIARESTIVIDGEGTVMSTQIITTKKVRAEQFLQVYLEDFASLMRIQTQAEFKIILWIGKSMNYQSNEIILIGSVKQKIAIECDITSSAVNNTITSLIKKNILIRNGRSVYLLNPTFFYKGKLEERDTLIRTIIYEIAREEEVSQL